MSGAPQSIQGGLLGTASNYGYPLTSGLLGAIGNAGGVGPFAQAVSGQPLNYWSQQALDLAGNPHAGPYANGGALGSGPTVSPVAATSGGGSSSGGSSASRVAGGLLAALGKNPSLVKNATSAIDGLLGSGLSAYASGAPADAAVTGELGSVGAQTAPEAASIQAGNDAALSAADGGAAGAGAGLLSTGALASGAAADAAVTGALGSVGAQTAGEAAAIQAANDAAIGGSAAASGAGAGGAGAGAGAGAGLAPALAGIGAGVGAFGAEYALAHELNAMFTGQNNNWSIGDINGLLGTVKNGLSSGLLSTSNKAGSFNPVEANGSINSQAVNDMSALTQLEAGDFGQASPYVQQQLTQMGFKVPTAATYVPTAAGGGGAGPRGLVKRY